MNRAYDRKTASDLLPLLDVILREVTERRHELRILERRLRRAREAEDVTDTLELRAQIALHRREIRLALAEVQELGCVIESDSPLQVLIPGADGRLEGGYRWDAQALELSL